MKYITFEKWQHYYLQLEYDMDNFKGTQKEKFKFFKVRLEKSWNMHQEVIFGRMKDLGIKLESTRHLHSTGVLK